MTMDQLQLSSINYLAVLAAWFVHVASGLVWFRPELFGREWSRLTGKELKPAKQWLLPGLLGHLLMILVLVVLIKLTRAGSGWGGMGIALLAWIGFVVPLESGELVWEKIPFRLFLLRTGNQLLGMAASGFILGAWQ
jgi:hypothetical protein